VTDRNLLHRLDIPLGQRYLSEHREQYLDALASAHAVVNPEAAAQQPTRDTNLIAGLERRARLGWSWQDDNRQRGLFLLARGDGVYREKSQSTQSVTYPHAAPRESRRGQRLSAG
jgi:hypothetical protein